MNDPPVEAYGEAWLSLSKEQRSELLSVRRDNQLSEKALDHVLTSPTNSETHQTKELGHAQEVLHRSRP
ncbi:hypothetical protein ACSHWB_38290 [Lentzea sp. HUAS TT2]|uniref:hypothetical protein n=1 Tax=Lentzea sp. HUAS TT2 TaxID=3447454 RepID=UPI003F6E9412